MRAVLLATRPVGCDGGGNDRMPSLSPSTSMRF